MEAFIRHANSSVYAFMRIRLSYESVLTKVSILWQCLVKVIRNELWECMKRFRGDIEKFVHDRMSTRLLWIRVAENKNYPTNFGERYPHRISPESVERCMECNEKFIYDDINGFFVAVSPRGRRLISITFFCRARFRNNRMGRTDGQMNTVNCIYIYI